METIVRMVGFTVRVRSRTRALVGVATAVGSMALCSAAADAGVATSAGGIVRYADPAGIADDLEVSVRDAAPAGWLTTLNDLQTPPEAGAGCTGVDTFHSGPDCPTGAASPAEVAIDLGGGDDKLTFFTQTRYGGQRVVLLGGDGRDQIWTYQTDASIDGGGGEDRIVPEFAPPAAPLPQASPASAIRGGSGIDTVDYTAAVERIDVSLDGRANDGRPGEGDDVATDVENVTASPVGGTLVGSAAANVLTGRGGVDRLVGGAGRDQLDGQAGNDTVDALDGAAGDRVACDLGADTAYVDGGDVVDRTCERIVYAPAIASSKLRHRKQRVSVRLTCPRLGPATCAGTVRLTAADGGRTIAGARYRIRTGARATVSLRVQRKPARDAVLIVAPRGSAPSAGRAVTIA